MMSDGVYDRSAEAIRSQAPVSPAVTSATSTAGKWLVIAATTFNLMLCFVATRGWVHMGNAIVAAVELSILGIGFYRIKGFVSTSALSIMCMICVYLVGVKFINAAANLKILHDIGICYIFYYLGRMSGRGEVNATMRVTMAIVLAVGFFELVATNLFGELFNIWQYYVEKGVITASTINYSHSTFFRSGDRAGSESRTFFPGLLGPHRVSSVFLEPVSLGNYASVVFAYCISVSKNIPGQRRIWLYAASLLCVVLGDSRFAFGCCVLMGAVRMLPFRRSNWLVFLMPIGIATILLVIGSLNERPGIDPAIVSDDLKGRLLFSARLLDDWGLAQWVAFAPSHVYTADTGYAYVVNALGLPLGLLLLGVFAFHRTLSAEAGLMKAMIAVYFSASLCIGAAAFSIKTAALLWLAYGALDAGPAVKRWRQTSFRPRDVVPDPLERPVL